MLDKLPPLVQDALILLGGALLAWVGQDLMPILGPWLAARPPLGPLAGALLAQVLLVLLPLTRQYGRGAPGRHEAPGGAR